MILWFSDGWRRAGVNLAQHLRTIWRFAPACVARMAGSYSAITTPPDAGLPFGESVFHGGPAWVLATVRGAAAAGKRAIRNMRIINHAPRGETDTKHNKRKIMKIKNALCGLLPGLLLMAAGTFIAQAVPITVSDFGATAPVLNPLTDTGYTPTVVHNEVPLNWTSTTETFGQSFKLPASGIVDKVYFGYRSFGLGDTDGLVNFTFRLDVDMNGTYEVNQQFVGVNRVDFETSTASSWIEFDLSAANITLAAGTTHAAYWNSDNPVGQWAAVVRYDNTPLANYADGTSLGTSLPPSGRDAWFAVTTRPVPDGGSTFALASLSCLGLAGMNWFQRRRAASV